MPAADYKTIVQQFYVAYFGRPADPSGLANISAMLDAAMAPTDTQGFVNAYKTNSAVKSIIDLFGDSTESHQLYVGDTRAFVSAIYDNVLGRAPDAEGLAYWVKLIDAGELSRGSAALTIMAGAQGNASSQGLQDAATVAAKVSLAVQFTDALGTPSAQSSYAGNAAAAAARAMLAGQGSVASTLERLVDPVPLGLDLLAADDSGSSNADNQTRFTSGLTITGSAAGAARVELYDGSSKVAIGSGVVSNGRFSIDVALSEASHTITAVGFTGAGTASRSSAGLDITVDSSAPAALQLALVEDSGAAGDGITNQAGLVITGTAAKASVQYSSDGLSWSGQFNVVAGVNNVLVRQTDAAGNSSPITALKFTFDKVAPTLASSLPASAALEVAVASNIVLSFSETVQLGSGDIIISDGQHDVRVVPVGDASQVQLSGKVLTINPTLPLNDNGRYSVTLPDSAIADAAGNTVAGLAGSTTLRFTTVDAVAPQLVSSTPSLSRVDVSPLANVYLTFDEAVKAGTGSFTLSDGAGDIRAIAVSDSQQVSFNGSAVTINPSLPLKAGASYSLQFGPGVLKDMVGNSFAGIGAGAVAFTTAASAASLASMPARSGFMLDADRHFESYGSTASYDFIGSGIGKFVAGVGDLNGDGLADVVIAASSGGGTTTPPTSDGLTYSLFLVYGSADSNPSSVALDRLNGSNGMRIDMPSPLSTYTALLQSAGDVNGDGVADLLISDKFAKGTSPTATPVGAAFVMYGAQRTSATFDLATLNGSNGYRINGTSNIHYLGRSIGAADINGDGFGDVIVGASGSGNTLNPYGSSYVQFGSAAGPGASVGLSGLSMRIEGEQLNSYTGAATNAGDFNGDGFADIAVGARWLGGIGGGGYLVFGKSGAWPSTLSLSTVSPASGLRITNAFSADSANFVGDIVSAAGDINGDGYADLMLASDEINDSYVASTFIVFGRANDSTGKLDLDKLDGKNGFRVTHAGVLGAGMTPLAAIGDFNGDGYDDLLVGAPGSAIAGKDAGAVYVVFGKASGFSAKFDVTTLDAASAWRIDGVTGSKAGTSLSSAGDINGDGFDDIIIGAPGMSNEQGAAFIVYGRDITGAVRYLGDSGADTLTGTTAGENFVAGSGNDLMVGGGGADVFHGGSGNDIIVLADLAARRIDGGSGSDTLRLSGAKLTLDLALFRNRIEGIETIDLSGSGDNTLKVLARDLLNLNEAGNSLQVDGNAGDKVVLGSGWTDSGINGAYHRYVQGEAVILIGVDLSVTF